jgi:hypothetical protein
MLNNSEISLYVDAMILEAIVDDPSIVKNAGIGDKVMALIYKVKDYFASKIDPNRKVESVLNLLAPGAIGVLFSSLRFTWIGVFFALAIQIFKIDVGGAITSAYNSIKSLISGGQQTSSQAIDSAVAQAVNSNYRPATANDEAEAIKKLQKREFLSIDTFEKNSFVDVEQRLRDARTIKLAMISFQEGNFEKKAAWLGLAFATLQTKIVGILTSILGYVFKIGLGSAGAIVAGDVIRNFLDRTGITTPEGTAPSAVSGPSMGAGFMDSVKRLFQPSTVTSTYVATQTHFPKNKTYQDTPKNAGDTIWAEGFTNNSAGISEMLIEFAKEVYSGLNGLESTIRSCPTFQETVRTIAFFNRSSAGSTVVIIPKAFNTKKQLVDLFIDEVAGKVS